MRGPITASSLHPLPPGTRVVDALCRSLSRPTLFSLSPALRRPQPLLPSPPPHNYSRLCFSLPLDGPPLQPGEEGPQGLEQVTDQLATKTLTKHTDKVSDTQYKMPAGCALYSPAPKPAAHVSDL